MAKPAHHSGTRQQLLRAALKHFANSGYAATSVQDIVDDARLSKPALYYHFQDKAGLFQALVHEAHDERYRLLRAAAESHAGIRAQLEAVLAALFAYFRENRDLMRISFASMFAAPGEAPEDAGCEEKCQRNFEFVHALIKTAQNKAELDQTFDSQDLAFGFYGLVNFYLVGHLVSKDCQPNQLTATRIVELFLAGAGPKACVLSGGHRAKNGRLLAGAGPKTGTASVSGGQATGRKATPGYRRKQAVNQREAMSHQVIAGMKPATKGKP